MKYKSKKIFAIFLVLTLIFSMSSVSFADTTDAADGYSLADFGSKVGSITITGAAVDRYTQEVEAYERGSGSNVETFHKYTYNIVLAQGTSPTATVTANFTKSADAGENCYIAPFGTLMQPPQGPIILMNNARLNYAATLSEGVGTTTAYVTYNLTNTDSFAGYGKYDTYVFNYSIADSSKTVTTSSGITMRFGDPAYAETAPESEMRFTGSGNTYTAVYRGTRDGYYPNILSLYMSGGSITATTENNATNNVCFVTYGDDGAETEVSSISSSGNSNKLSATVRVKAAGSIKINNTVTLNFEAPREPAVPGGITPSRVVSYLPIGQFATGSGWGSATGKFTGGYSATGVSLGALGGYIEFEFAKGIANNSNNPYGVDFVVYGNAFNGNPEAGAVQVSEDGKTWYELAGSMYYDGNFNYVGTKVANKFSAAYTGTLNNATVEYTKGSSITVGLKDASGSYAVPTGTLFGPAAWFPATDKYPQGDAHDNTGANVTVSHTANNLAFSGITAIQDYNTTATYAFGYADVTPNGSPATYGDAVNPYTLYTTAKTGGDGFDLEWAVDPATKMPIDVNGKTFRYVRVYSAVLDNATFGETSTEVCGIFTTANGQKNANGSAVDVGRTAAPTVKVDNKKIERYAISYCGDTVIVDTNGALSSGKAITVTTDSNTNVYINSAATTSYTATSNAPVRVIAQSGEKAPYLIIIK